MEALKYEYRLQCSPEDAFAAYTGRIGDWWDARYSANPDTFETVTIEPRVGGRIYATHTDLGRVDWGEVREWEPGRKFGHTFTLAQDPQHPTVVAVRFSPAEGDGCFLDFAHVGWTAANVADREKFGDWPVLLDRFAALADGS